jgi:hypothetical protein
MPREQRRRESFSTTADPMSAAQHSRFSRRPTPSSLHPARTDEELMAEYGEWNRKGATLSDVTAGKEYGVSRDFIIKGIRAGKLEFREGAIWGNPYLRILRRQLEAYIAEESGKDRLATVKNETELRRVKKEINALNKRLRELQERKKELEGSLAAAPRKVTRRATPRSRR